MAEMQQQAQRNGHARLDPTDDLVTALGPADRPDAPTDLQPDELTKLYAMMVENRLVDERMITLQRQGRIGFYIGSVGEEAAILGSAFALRPTDWFFPCYRENGVALLRGLPLRRYFDNMVGNGSDPVLGRQMPNHLAFKAGNYVSVSSPIGTQLTQAVGAGWAAKLSGHDVVTMGFIGEGGTSSNEFHAAMNLAAVVKAPTIIVVRNNQWAISTPREKQTVSETFAIKAVAYGMPGVRVDGNDLLACYQVARAAVERARRGEGPTLIECLTYRVLGHSTSDDPKVYRKDEDVEPWRKKDPLERTRHYLEQRHLWDGEQEKALRAKLDLEIREQFKAAEDAPPPELPTLFSDVYAKPFWHLREEEAEAATFGPAEKH